MALVLPAAEVTIANSATTALGWEAAVTSLILGATSMSDPMVLFFALSALGNIVFVLAPWMLLKRRGRRVKLFYAAAVLVAVLLAAALPVVTHDFLKIHAGFVAWLLAYLLLLAAAGMRIATNEVP